MDADEVSAEQAQDEGAPAVEETAPLSTLDRAHNALNSVAGIGPDQVRQIVSALQAEGLTFTEQ